jgi:putative ABC transport system permease protein
MGDDAAAFRNETGRASRSGPGGCDSGADLRPGVILSTRPEDPARPFAEAHLQSLPGWEERVHVVDGRLPQAGGEEMEVVISERGSMLSHLAPGDTVRLALACDEGDQACQANPRAVTARVAGVVAPIWDEDPFWASGWPTYLEPAYVESNPGLILPLLTPTASFTAAMRELGPPVQGASAWYMFTLPERLSRGNINGALADVEQLNKDVSGQQGIAFSPLRHVIGQFQRESDHQRAPLTILLLELSGIALFYLVLVGSAVMDRQAREIALLRSRGTSTAQVVASHVVEAAIIGAATVVLAPLLAAAAISLLGLTPVFDKVSHGDRLPVTVLPSAVGFAALGALLGVLAVAVPAWVAARRGLVAQRQAEARPSKPFFQRFYLDVAFAGIALLLLWELRERGSVYTPSATGGVTTDPLLLASPALLVFAVGMLFLRIYPLVLRGIAWLVSRGPGTSSTMALAYLVRRPGQYGQLALLLLVAVAVGTFAASYTSTTDRSLEDRAAFESGVAFRAGSGDDAGKLGNSGTGADAEIQGLDGVDRASAVMRISGDLSLSGDRGRSVQLLAVDAPAASEMLWFRDDFADVSWIHCSSRWPRRRTFGASRCRARPCRSAPG